MKTLHTLIASILVGAFVTSAYADLDTDSATVSLSVAQFAALTNLDDFVLTTTDPDGSASANYTGSDSFDLESNTQVRVTLSGGDMSNGTDTIPTSYDIDSVGLIMDTTANSVHDAPHVVSAEAILGAISAQQAGSYSSEITLTVSAL